MSTQDTTLPPLPNVPKEILTLIHAYGDERADESMTWAEHYRELIAALREWGAAIAAQAQQPVVSAYRVNTKGGRSWVVNGAPSARDLAEIENLGDSVELLGATVKDSLTPQQAQQAQAEPRPCLSQIAESEKQTGLTLTGEHQPERESLTRAGTLTVTVSGCCSTVDVDWMHPMPHTLPAGEYPMFISTKRDDTK